MPTFSLKSFKYFSNTFIETGCCQGEGVQRALDAGFTRVKSVDIYDPFYQHCIERFKGKPVDLYLGKSTDQLDKMLEDVYEPAVILLDAHPAGPNTGGHDDLMEKGDKSEFQQTLILQKEIKIILEHPKRHLIIIDDQTPEEALIYMDILKGYRFEFFDEQLPNIPLAKDKILVCYPV
jgi:hypothetical protein